MGVKSKGKQGGFALLELVLLLVIVAAIVGVGLYVVNQKSTSDNTLSGTGSGATAKPAQGTTASVEQLTEQDANTEAGVDKSADGSTQQTATSADSSVNSLGGAYNEANY